MVIVAIGVVVDVAALLVTGADEESGGAEVELDVEDVMNVSVVRVCFDGEGETDLPSLCAQNGGHHGFRGSTVNTVFVRVTVLHVVAFAV